MKRSNVLKALSLLLSLIFMVGLLNGCGGTEKNAQDTGSVQTSGTGSQTTQKGDAKPITLKLFNMDETAKNSYVCKEIEKKYNIILESREVKQDAFKEQYQTMIASNDIPDIFTWLDFPTYSKYVSQGILAEIPVDMLKSTAPRICEWQQKYIGEDPFKYHMRDGKLYAIPMLWTLGAHMNVNAIREDWLTNLGITKTPETLDELEAVFEKFKNGDPDKNGKNDTYAVSGVIDDVFSSFSYVFGAYGVYVGIFYEDNGKVLRGEVQPGAKQALVTLNKWYKAGYIDPECIVNKWNNVQEKWLAEKFGFVNWAWWELSSKDALFNGSFYEQLLQKNPNAKLTIIPYPKGPEGKAGGWQVNPVRDAGVNFGKPMENDKEKMQKYLEVMDSGSFDKDILQLTFEGVEGTTFKINADGDYEWIPPYDDEKERLKFGIGLSENNRQIDIGLHFQDYDARLPFLSKKKYWSYVADTQGKAIGEYDILEPIDKPVYNEKIDALKKFTTENYINFITGKKPIDEFDKFVADWMSMGGEQVMAEAQEKYDQYLKK